jgi:hypothetical protein
MVLFWGCVQIVKFIEDLLNVFCCTARSATSGAPRASGMQLGKSTKANQFLESLKAEGEVIVEAVAPGPVRSAVPVITDPIMVGIEEKLTVTLKKDGGLENLVVQGTMSLIVQKEEDAFIRVQVETGANKVFNFNTHPNIDKNLYSEKSILGLKDPKRPFPTGTSLAILRWRMQSKQESLVPLSSKFYLSCRKPLLCCCYAV